MLDHLFFWAIYDYLIITNNYYNYYKANYIECVSLIWKSLYLDTRWDHNYGVNELWIDDVAIETNDDYHGDLPQCGYYQAAGKIFACRAFKWRGISLP